MTTSPAASELHEQVLRAIGSRILASALPPGQVLTLEEICAEHRVSRTLAREVVRVLESMGLVRARRRVGITVQPAGNWSVFDPRLIRWRLDGAHRAEFLLTLSELRRGFEPVAAGFAAQRATEAHHRALAAAVSAMIVHGRSGDLDQYLEADKLFHTTLLAASGNEMFQALGDVVHEILAARTHHGMMPTLPKPKAIALHDQVARCIQTGDAEGAERALREIISEVTEAVAETGVPGR